MDDKETARKLGDPVVVCTNPDVCKSPTAPVPYQITAPLTPSINTASTVRATKVNAFTMASAVPQVVGDEAGVGKGVVSGTHAGGGLTTPTGSSGTVRAEGSLVVRNGDPFSMNSGNTTGKLVYQPGGGPRAKVDANGKPTRDTNPPVQPKPEEQGWLDWAGSKAKGAWNATSNAAGDAWNATSNAAGNAWDWTAEKAGQGWQYAKDINNEYKVVPRALGGVQAIGGAGEVALGAVGLAAPTGVTQVAGGVAVVHGADNIGTGLRQVWTGNYENTLTHQAAAGTARMLGASEVTADRIGTVTDLGVGIAAPATVAKGVAQQGLKTAAREGAEALESGAAKSEAALAREAEEAAAKKAAAREAEEEAAKKKAAQEGKDGVRVLKKPTRPDTSKVKYPDDMSPYKKPNGEWDWPGNKGFEGVPKDEVLQPGTVLDRFGGDGGKYFSPPGTPYEARALSPDSLTAPYRGFEVLKPLPVQSGPIAPAFGMPGGGTQYLTGQSLGDLVKGGYLREIP